MIWMTRNEGGGWSALIVTGDFLDLESLPRRLRELLENPDFSNKVTACLFPQAYHDDPESESEYQRLLRDELVQRKLECLDAFEKAIGSGTTLVSESGVTFLRVDLNDEELALWLGFLHDIRMVIGTGLDITDDYWSEQISPDDPNYQQLLLLDHLSHLEQTILGALQQVEELDLGEDLE